jgi:hypothetical protein
MSIESKVQEVAHNAVDALLSAPKWLRGALAGGAILSGVVADAAVNTPVAYACGFQGANGLMVADMNFRFPNTVGNCRTDEGRDLSGRFVVQFTDNGALMWDSVTGEDDFEPNSTPETFVETSPGSGNVQVVPGYRHPEFAPGGVQNPNINNFCSVFRPDLCPQGVATPFPGQFAFNPNGERQVQINKQTQGNINISNNVTVNGVPQQ